jgi:hypothetical protein
MFLNNFYFLKHRNKINQFILFFVISSILVIIILDSNFEMSFIKKNVLPIDHRIIIFSMYVFTFITSSLLLLNKTYHNTHTNDAKFKNNNLYFISISIIFSFLSLILITTITQLLFLENYSNLVFYFTSYIAFISSFGFLLILSVKFFRWYLIGKNYFTLAYGILFAIYCLSLLLALLYLINGLATHPSNIHYSSPRELRAGTFSINIMFQNNIAIMYDISFIISFLLAWILTVFMLKQYSRRIGKYKFWILVSLPLIFYLLRYEGIILSYFAANEFLIPSTIGSIYSSIGAAFFNAFINSNIQTSGIFFGFSFFAILFKLKNFQLRNDMIITVIGMMILFASRDFYSIFLNSFPPSGIITISFMPIGSFMLLIGLMSFLKLATRDKQFYTDIITKLENDTLLLKNILLSEKEIETSKKIKPLLEYSFQWQKEHDYKEMKIEEVKQIIDDVISEFHEKKTLQSFKADDKSRSSKRDNP